MSLHSDTVSSFCVHQSLLLPLNAVCLVEKQQIPISYGLTQQGFLHPTGIPTPNRDSYTQQGFLHPTGIPTPNKDSYTQQGFLHPTGIPTPNRDSYTQQGFLHPTGIQTPKSTTLKANMLTITP